MGRSAQPDMGDAFRQDDMAKLYVGWEADVPAREHDAERTIAPLSARLAATSDRPPGSTPFWLRQLGEDGSPKGEESADRTVDPQ